MAKVRPSLFVPRHQAVDVNVVAVPRVQFEQCNTFHVFAAYGLRLGIKLAARTKAYCRSRHTDFACTVTRDRQPARDSNWINMWSGRNEATPIASRPNDLPGEHRLHALSAIMELGPYREGRVDPGPRGDAQTDMRVQSRIRKAATDKPLYKFTA